MAYSVFDLFQSIFPNWRFPGQNYPIITPLSSGIPQVGQAILPTSSTLVATASVSDNAISSLHAHGNINLAGVVNHFGTVSLINNSILNATGITNHFGIAHLLNNSNISAVSFVSHFAIISISNSSKIIAGASVVSANGGLSFIMVRSSLSLNAFAHYSGGIKIQNSSKLTLATNGGFVGVCIISAHGNIFPKSFVTHVANSKITELSVLNPNASLKHLVKSQLIDVSNLRANLQNIKHAVVNLNNICIINPKAFAHYHPTILFNARSHFHPIGNVLPFSAIFRYCIGDIVYLINGDTTRYIVTGYITGFYILNDGLLEPPSNVSTVPVIKIPKL